MTFKKHLCDFVLTMPLFRKVIYFKYEFSDLFSQLNNANNESNDEPNKVDCLDSENFV